MFLHSFPRRRGRRRLGALVLAAALLTSATTVVALSPTVGHAQAGIFCPGTGDIIVSYQGETFTGKATQVEGWGTEATYTFMATSGDGDVIVGVAQASIIDCVAAGSTGLVEMNDVQVNGYSSGGGTNV